jgi:hypothetical protein
VTDCEVSGVIKYYKDILRSIFLGKKVIVIAPKPERVRRTVAQLLAYGARSPLVLSTEQGGEVVGAQSEVIRTRPGGPDATIQQFAWARATATRLADPDAALSRVVDEYDPHRRALVYGLPECTMDTLLNRRRYGWSRPEWRRYEDKTLIDTCWERWGVPHGNSCVVRADAAAVATAQSHINEGAGVVLAGDAKNGFHGGAVAVRFARTNEQLSNGISFLSRFCDFVRVMPFYEGIPVSIHAIVFNKEVAVFRPMELLVFRRPAGQFVFTGTSTFWQLPEDDEEGIRDVARLAGQAMRSESGYRGAFAIDGIVTKTGFIPTEINARLASGIGDGIPEPELPLEMLARTGQEEDGIDFRAAELERIVIGAMRQHPAIEFGLSVPEARIADMKHFIADVTGISAMLKQRLGVSFAVQRAAAGAVLRLSAHEPQFTRHAPAAQQVLAALSILDERLGDVIGDLGTARIASQGATVSDQIVGPSCSG